MLSLGAINLSYDISTVHAKKPLLTYYGYFNYFVAMVYNNIMVDSAYDY